jgi:hypothetical protein
MCLHDPEKIHSGLEIPLNPKELRTLLQEAALCSSCLSKGHTRPQPRDRMLVLSPNSFQESFGLSRREIEMIGCGTWT